MNKRIFCFFIFLILFSTSSLANQEFYPYLGEITKDKINVRAGESTNFEKVSVLYKEDEVVVEKRKYSWLKIRLPQNAASFISQKYVKLINANLGEVTADKVNIRAGASINRTILVQVNKGDQIKILEQQKDWYKIVPMEGSFGWVLDDLVAFKSSNIDQYVAEEDRDEIETDNIDFSNRESVFSEIDQRESIEQPSSTVRIYGYLDVRDNEKAYRLKIDQSNQQGQSSIPAIEGERFLLLSNLHSLPQYFLSHKVVIDGKIDSKDSSLQTVNVSKIQLAL